MTTTDISTPRESASSITKEYSDSDTPLALSFNPPFDCLGTSSTYLLILMSLSPNKTYI